MTSSFLSRLSPLFGAVGLGRKQTYVCHASFRKHPQYIFITFGEETDSSCEQEDKEIIFSFSVTFTVSLKIYWFRSHSLQGKRNGEVIRRVRPAVLPWALWQPTESLFSLYMYTNSIMMKPLITWLTTAGVKKKNHKRIASLFN